MYPTKSILEYFLQLRNVITPSLFAYGHLFSQLKCFLPDTPHGPFKTIKEYELRQILFDGLMQKFRNDKFRYGE